jgi:hypothetical protein
MLWGWRQLGVAMALITALACPFTVQASSDYVTVLTGIGQGNLEAPQLDYRIQHIVVAYGRDIKPYIQRRLHLNPPGKWDFRWEPFFTNITSPGRNVEAGCMASLRIGIPVSDAHWLPYIVGGTGPMYTSQHTREQSTQWNFVSYGALGVEYRMDEHSAVCAEVWTRHYSNASIKDPNDGIDTRDWLIGYTLYQ